MAELDCCSKHVCQNVLVPDVHHIQPTAWGGPDIPENKRRVCPNVHRLTHTLLNRYKNLGEKPPYEERKHYNFYVRALAQDGWNATLQFHNSPSMITTSLTDLPDL